MTFTWRQKMILRAASAVDVLPFRALRQAVFPHGTYASLIRLGLLRQHREGWEITPAGRALDVWWNATDEQKRKLEENNMHPWKIRFYVTREKGVWLVRDRKDSRAVHYARSRKEARDKASELRKASEAAIQGEAA